MDHMMPGLSGFEALEIIRADARTAHLPVVMCTSHEDAEFAATAQRKGVVGILPKSVAPEKLPEILARLQEVVGRSPTPNPKAPAPSRTRPASPRPARKPICCDRSKSSDCDERIEARRAGAARATARRPQS